MKYSSAVEPVKNQLLGANSILVALPEATTVDKVAAGLSLMLSLKQAGKSVDVVTSDTLRVSHTNLFGIGEVKSQVVGGSRGSMGGGGTFTLTLEGVVDDEGNVNSEKLDYFQEGKNLQLIFTIPAGKKFEPERITTNYSGGSSGGGYDLIFVIGADNLAQLGTIYSANEALFAGSNIVNIDISQTNGQFGATNIIDINSSSLSEMMIQIIPDLGLNLTEDIATNLLTGIYDATSNMSTNVKPDTFVAASTAMQAGGKLPIENVANQGFVNGGGSQDFIQPQQLGVPPVQTAEPEPVTQSQPIPVVMEQPQAQPQQASQNPFMQPQGAQNQPQNQTPAVTQGDNSNFDLRQVFNLPVDPVSGQKDQSQIQPQNQAQNRPSEEERPQGERVTTNGPEVQNPAPDWLVPKIYKSGS